MMLQSQRLQSIPGTVHCQTRTDRVSSPHHKTCARKGWALLVETVCARKRHMQWYTTHLLIARCRKLNETVAVTETAANGSRNCKGEEEFSVENHRRFARTRAVVEMELVRFYETKQILSKERDFALSTPPFVYSHSSSLHRMTTVGIHAIVPSFV